MFGDKPSAASSSMMVIDKAERAALGRVGALVKTVGDLLKTLPGKLRGEFYVRHCGNVMSVHCPSKKTFLVGPAGARSRQSGTRGASLGSIQCTLHGVRV